MKTVIRVTTKSLTQRESDEDLIRPTTKSLHSEGLMKTVIRPTTKSLALWGSDEDCNSCYYQEPSTVRVWWRL